MPAGVPVPVNRPGLIFDECTQETWLSGKTRKWYSFPDSRGNRKLLFEESYDLSGTVSSYQDHEAGSHRVSVIASPVSMPPKAPRSPLTPPVSGSGPLVGAPPATTYGRRPISLPAVWLMFACDEVLEVVDKISLNTTRSWYDAHGEILWHEVIAPAGTVVEYRNHRVSVPVSLTPPPEEEEPVTTSPDATIPQSCLTCTNLLARPNVPSRYGRQVGGAMCAKLDKPIGRGPAMGDPAIFKFVADKVGATCTSYNKPAGSSPKRMFGVAFPSGSTAADKPGGDDRVSTCYSCVHFAPSEIVISEWGWTTGACSKLGTLVPEHQASFIGRTCDFSEFGEQRNTMLGVNLFPEYEDDFLTPDLIGDFLKGSGEFDPATHESDKPLTGDEIAQGIRAWYYVPDMERPTFETNVYLPIYDTGKMDPKTLSKVPRTGDDEHPESYIDHNNAVYKIAVLWTELDETPALWGPAGVGKTELFRYLAWMMQLPFERISITASTELDDLAGKMHFDPGKGTYFEYGRLPQAWQSPGIICIDEPNVGTPDVWQFLRPLTDNSKQLVLDMNEGERISRHLDAYMGMAMNPAWDPRNVGAAVIGDADGSRLMHISMDLPPEKIERKIITTRCAMDGYNIPPKVLKTVMAIGKEIRGLTEQGSLPLSWGVRNQIKVARATRWFSLAAAYKIAVGDYLEPQQAEQILDVVKANDHT